MPKGLGGFIDRYFLEKDLKRKLEQKNIMLLKTKQLSKSFGGLKAMNKGF